MPAQCDKYIRLKNRLIYPAKGTDCNFEYLFIIRWTVREKTNEHTKMTRKETVENEKTSPINIKTSPKPIASLKLEFNFIFEYKKTISNKMRINEKLIPTAA